jgi:hypothetical protein
MATRNARRNQQRNRTWAQPITPVQPSKELLSQLVSGFGSISGLIAKVHQFMKVRERYTGWRVVSDVASRDRYHFDERTKDATEREELPVPFPPMTAFLVAESGLGDALGREAIMAALAALAQEPEVIKAGLSIRPSVNEFVENPYATVSVARRGGAVLTPEQKDLFKE